MFRPMVFQVDEIAFILELECDQELLAVVKSFRRDKGRVACHNF
jgi:hypothetical protein